MERLTEKYDGNLRYYYPQCYDENHCIETSGIPMCEECSIPNKACQKLGEYEDLGLTPEQLRQIDDMYADRCKEISELRKQLAVMEEKTRERYTKITEVPPGWKEHIESRFSKTY